MTALVGSRPLGRLQLRRDRLWWPVWVVVIVVMQTATVGSYATLYPTAADRAALGTTMAGNPSLLALYGPAFDLSNPGGFSAWRVYGYTCLLGGLAALLGVIRHTRGEEESQRMELLRSGVLGRHSSLAAALATVAVWSVVSGALVAAGMAAQGLPLRGSLVMGLGLTLAMTTFAAVGAVAAQLVEHARTARGIAGAALGAAYLLRAIGDSSHELSYLSWFSPIGWAQQSRPYAGERPLVLLLPLVATAALVVVAVGLEGRRDLEAAPFASRLGPPRGGMRSVYGLVSRLERGSLIGWVVGVAVAGLALGAIAGGVLDLVAQTPAAAEILRHMGGAGAMVDTYFAALVPLIAAVGALLGVSAVGRLAAEEGDHRVELVLATATTRRRLLAAHLLWAFGGAVVLMLVAGAALALGAAASGEARGLLALTGACLAQVPAMWVVIGVGAVGVTLGPRYAVAGWVADGFCLFIAWIAPLLGLPGAVLAISPFHHLPHLPGGSMHWAPLVVLTLVGLALAGASLVAYRRRDLT